MSELQQWFQDIENYDCKIFSSGNKNLKLCLLIQILMVKLFDDVLAHHRIDVHEIADHPRRAINLAADDYFDGVVMTVTLGIVALPIGFAILLGGKRRIVQAMGSRNPVAPR